MYSTVLNETFALLIPLKSYLKPITSLTLANRRDVISPVTLN